MSLERVDAQGAVERLARARVSGPSGVAFDADGTLWSGDVGEDVFEVACQGQLLRDDPRSELERVSRAHGLTIDGSASDLARRLHEAYRLGTVDELLMCEVMTWCYAGFTGSEFSELARRALSERKLSERVRRSLCPVFEFAKREGLRVVVISASPAVIVTEGLRTAGFEVAALAGATPVLSTDGRIEPRLEGRVPYGPEKRVVGQRLLSTHDWLGSFGDNVFDVEMLRAARVGIAVAPKPRLLERLPSLSNTVILD